MKKILIGIVVFLFGAMILEMAARLYSANWPDINIMVIDSLYKSPSISKKLGEFKASNVAVDSVSNNKDIYFFTIGILGSMGDTTLKGVIVRGEQDQWKIEKLMPH